MGSPELATTTVKAPKTNADSLAAELDLLHYRGYAIHARNVRGGRQHAYWGRVGPEPIVAGVDLGCGRPSGLSSLLSKLCDCLHFSIVSRLDIVFPRLIFRVLADEDAGARGGLTV